MEKTINYNCRHISKTDWGGYACKLYNPRDNNCIVQGGNCESNTACPYKTADMYKDALCRIDNIVEQAKYDYRISEPIWNLIEQTLEEVGLGYE